MFISYHRDHRRYQRYGSARLSRQYDAARAAGALAKFNVAPKVSTLRASINKYRNMNSGAGQAIAIVHGAWHGRRRRLFVGGWWRARQRFQVFNDRRHSHRSATNASQLKPMPIFMPLNITVYRHESPRARTLALSPTSLSTQPAVHVLTLASIRSRVGGTLLIPRWSAVIELLARCR